MKTHQKPAALLCIVFVIYVAAIAVITKDTPQFPPDPASSVAATARHFWNTGNLRGPRFQELYHDFAEKSRSHPRDSLWQDTFSLGTDGALYPKHTILVSVLSAPFYGLFGDIGFWILSQLALFLFLAGVYRLSTEVSSPFTTAGGRGALVLSDDVHSYFALAPTGIFGGGSPSALRFAGEILCPRASWIGLRSAAPSHSQLHDLG